MREIKFKAKRVDNGEWVYGYVFEGNEGVYILQKKEKNIKDIQGLNVFKPIEVTPESLCQYTGLKDKNGVEIYECDYLVDKYPIDEEDLRRGYNESLLPVVWCSVSLTWCIDASFDKDGSYLTSLVEYFGKHLEIKGNKHD